MADGFAGGAAAPGDPRYAGAGWDGGTQQGLSTVRLDIGRAHLERWNSPNIVEKSCAINTMAHEIAHTLSHHSNQHLEYFLDTNTGPVASSAPIASYFIGSLAQCSWLQSQGRVGKSMLELNACMSLFGTHNFNSNRCDDFPNQ